SRRRHTRSKRDWSSDVCSSDLANKPIMWHPDEAEPTAKWKEGQPKRTFWACPIWNYNEGRVQVWSFTQVSIYRQLDALGVDEDRSEERRVGKECRMRWTGGD